LQYLEKWPLISALIINSILALLLHSAFKTHPVPDFSTIDNIKERKQQFFNFTYQQVISINQHVKLERDRLLELQNKTRLSYSDKRYIRVIAKKYYLTKNHNKSDLANSDKLVSQLLLRVDQIPPALVLAQAANESAWGTSRFAKMANNYFGIWCFSKGCGLIPKGRSEGKHHEVRRFSSVKDSIKYYIHLLNSHRTYVQLRAIRAEQRNKGMPLSAEDMAAGLIKYSERGEEYVKELVAMMKYNQLAKKFPLL